MNRNFIKSISAVLAAAFFFSGCAGTADGRKTQAQGTAIGAIGGALLGAAIGAATGNRDAALRGAAIGGAAGAAGGFVYGSMVAKRKAKYVAAEDWLDAEISIAEKANRSAHAYNASLKRRVASLDSRIRVAKAQGNQGELRKLKSEVGQIRVEVQNQNKSEVQFEKDQSEVLSDSKAKGASNYGEYRSLSQSFRQAKAERGSEVGRLASLEQSIGG